MFVTVPVEAVTGGPAAGGGIGMVPQRGLEEICLTSAGRRSRRRSSATARGRDLTGALYLLQGRAGPSDGGSSDGCNPS